MRVWQVKLEKQKKKMSIYLQFEEQELDPDPCLADETVHASTACVYLGGSFAMQHGKLL